MRRKLIGAFNLTSMGDCPVCIQPFEAGQLIVNLPCHVKHQVHKECFDSFIKFFKDKNKEPRCPICRAKVEESKVVSLVLP